MFKLTTSAGNSVEQPVRPGDRFSGVLVVQLNRPISATQVVLDLTASERWATTLKGTTRPERTQFFAPSLVLWKAARNGAANASTVLSDGLHVFNFSCQIPNLNYPQNVQSPEFDITYLLEARLMAPKDYGGEQVAGKVAKDLFFTPLVVLLPSPEPHTSSGETVTNESILFGIPTVPIGAMNTEHLDFTHFIRIEVVIPSWLSSDRSVYMDMPVQMMTCDINSAARFLSRRGSIPSIEGKQESDNSSVVSGKSESSGLRSAHTSDRVTVISADTQALVMNTLPPRYYEIPVDQRPIPSLVFVKQMNMSQIQQQQQQQNQQQQDLISYQQQMQQQMQQQNMRQPGMDSIAERSSSSGNSITEDHSKEKYRSRPLPMAPAGGMSGGPNPPPLPAEPMPMGVPTGSRPPSSRTLQAPMSRREGQVHKVNISVQQNMRTNPLILSPYDPNDAIPSELIPMRSDSPVSGSTSATPEEAYAMGGTKMREHTSHLHTPISPPYNNMNNDDFSDDDSGYFKDTMSQRPMDREHTNENDMYQARKNSLIKHYR
ncbi:hypothetical protein EV180_000721 [Coemansia sp. RSA 518]|nr:hypothetical protein IW143_000434 [Coemansia sp. RSA 520]KAJ2230889.1 hypothetical protein EV180_000721 [Coemansia sp. RSA 518]